MADTVVTDAIPIPQDEGLPNITDDNEVWGSAGSVMALALVDDVGSYIRTDEELTFTSHDGTNDEVSVTKGMAFIDLQGEAISVQSTLGGTSSPSYDTQLPTEPSIVLVCPSATGNISTQSGTLSSVWLAYATDGTVTGISAGDIYIRSDDTGSISEPPHPNVKLGETNPDSPSSDVLSNRFPHRLDSGQLGTLTTGQDSDDFTITNVSTDETEPIGDISIFPRTTTAFSGYSFNYVDYSVSWTGSQWDVEVTVNWDTPSGSRPGDLDLDYIIWQGGTGSRERSKPYTTGPITTSTYNGSWHERIVANTANNSITVNLPPPRTIGEFAAVKGDNANTMSLSTPGGQSIGNPGISSPIDITDGGQSRTFICDENDVYWVI